MSQLEAAAAGFCKLDVHVGERLQELEVPGLRIIQTTSPTTKEHAFSRAARTVADFWLSRYVQRGDRNALHLQHEARGAWVTDCCRRLWSPGDDNRTCTLVEGGQCAHERRAAQGGYDVIVLLDVPLSANDAANLMIRANTKEILLAVHNYDDMSGKLGDQTYVWMPCEAPVSGCTGEYYITAPGVSAIREPDLFYLKSCSFDGLRIEKVATLPLYSVFSIKLCDLTKTTLCVQPSMVFGSLSPAGTYKLTERMNYHRFSSTFGVVEDAGKFYATDPREVLAVYEKCEARDSTDTLRDRLTTHAYSLRGRRTEIELLLSVCTSLKANREAPYLFRGYEPEARGIFGTPWFAWMTPTRRAIEARNNTLRRGLFTRDGFKATMLLVSLVLLCFVFAPVPYVSVDQFSTNWVTDGVARAIGHSSASDYAPPLTAVYCHDLAATWWDSVMLRSNHLTLTVGLTFAGAPLRFVMVLMAFAAMLESARAQQIAFGQMVRIAYAMEPFGVVLGNGPLSEHGTSFGLPSLVAERELRPIAHDAEVKILPVDDDGSKERDGLFGVGIGFGSLIPAVMRPCQANELIAVRNRQCARMPDYDKSAFEEAAALFVAMYPTPSQRDVVVDYQAWDERFPVGRRKEHAAAYEQWQRGVPPSEAELRAGKSFIKVEKINKLNFTGLGEYYDPRLISGQPDWYNVIAGPWEYAYGKLMKPLFTHTKRTFYVDGSSAAELGQWFLLAHEAGGAAVCGDDQILVIVDAPYVWYVEIDGSRHDAHMHEGFYRLKWSIVHKTVAVPPLVSQVYERGQLMTSAKTPHGVSYKHAFRVRSGDPDTKRGNSMMAHFVAWLAEREYDTKRGTIQSEAQLNEFQTGLEHKLAEQFGYEIKTKVSNSASDVSFLSGCFYPVAGTVIWGPKVGKLLARIGWTTTRVDGQRMWTQLAGTLNSFAAYRFLPFLRVYLNKVMSLVPEAYRSQPPTERRRIDTTGITVTEPDQELWDFFLARYGLTERDELTFSVELANATSLPYLVDSRVIEVLAAVDLA